MSVHHLTIKRIIRRIKEGTITEEELKTLEFEMEDVEKNPEKYLTDEELRFALKDAKDIANHVFQEHLKKKKSMKKQERKNKK